MSRADRAEALFRDRRNCAQAVLTVFCEAFGLPAETALRLACGLGRGMTAGEICGAASGGTLAIGLKYGPRDAVDLDGRKACQDWVADFIRAFREKTGGLTCRDILDGADPMTRPACCVQAVRAAAELLAETVLRET
jgi:C_GCAxxG_C_C family probable redox protein